MVGHLGLHGPWDLRSNHGALFRDEHLRPDGVEDELARGGATIEDGTSPVELAGAAGADR